MIVKLEGEPADPSPHCRAQLLGGCYRAQALYFDIYLLLYIHNIMIC